MDEKIKNIFNEHSYSADKLVSLLEDLKKYYLENFIFDSNYKSALDKNELYKSLNAISRVIYFLKNMDEIEITFQIYKKNK